MSVTEERRHLSSEEFRDIIGRFASGVTVITASQDGERKGTTASAFTSLSLDPPMVLVCLNRSSSTCVAVTAAKRFAVNILGEDQAAEAMSFAKKEGDKFAGTEVQTGHHGVPLLANALATLECSVEEVFSGGTHSVFFGAVERASARSGAPLAYFRGQFGRLELAQDEAAFEEIKERVLSRDIEIGQPIRLDDLAERFGSPRGPVYHALTRLIGEGLVTRDTDGSFVVTPLTLEAVRGAWRARCAIELGVAALTVGTLTPEQVAELKTLAAAAEPAPADSFVLDDWLPAYMAFHEGVIGLANSEGLLEAFRRVNAPAMILSVTQRQMEAAGLDREQCATAHQQMLDLVSGYETGNVAAANGAINSHEELAREVAVRFMEDQGGSI
jgi:flavin reductase (DIM6/NTAB) family NADH-FMN oxidoreductase RutF/DNA-binding FadR family transcriptional regulator